MHDIEPYYKWRQYYIASEDSHSPFYGRQYSEFTFSNRIYNYYVHPQWDVFNSETLVAKILFVDYEDRYAMIELMGEWNDAINDDMMHIKNDMIDKLMYHDINKFIIYCDNVLNYHSGEIDYYELLNEELMDENGWLALVNLNDHVVEEMEAQRLQYFIHFGDHLNDLNWRLNKPTEAYLKVIYQMMNHEKQLK